ncbi:hypothetical protein [Spirochaeta thermophila]|uniref:Uncharacterized protein n=1 Tax=Winmispira thermophila (strain ATCC 49972 / DSM 6192 / RI 19.B1) TaxID=665571 RepID=E0RQN8_WINT6|nr:hypothetical protein [Spirochaeta thermophila]ADN01542.1 hypothetical protein STHERM_c05770 [Spirochaeta thermophila DSM 6192]
MDHLTALVLAYQRGGVPFEALFHYLAWFVYTYPSREEERSDFLLFFYPRLKALARRFVYTGVPFLHYLRSSMRWQYRTFKRVQQERASLERSLVRREHEEAVLLFDPSMKLEEGEADAVMEEIVEWIRGSAPHRKQRFLCLLLRELPSLPPRWERPLAAALDMEEERLAGCFLMLQERVTERKARYLRLSRKINELRMEIRLLEDRLSREGKGCDRDAFRKGLERRRRQLARLERRRNGIPLKPRHSDIAEVLGIPKGTVDSGIHYLLKELSSRRPPQREGISLRSLEISSRRACQGSVAHLTLTG